MSTRHRRAADADVPHGSERSHQRSEDRNPFAKLAAFADRYKILWVASVAIASFISVSIIKPLRQISATVTATATAQDSLIKRVSALEETQRDLASASKDMAGAIKILTKVACVKSISATEAYQYGVDCKWPAPGPTKAP